MDGDGALVTLVVPATAEYLRLARLASADAGSRAGFDYEEIDDLRIAVTELCHLLIGDGGTGRMTLEFRPLDDGIAVEGRAADPPPRNDDDHVSETILATVVDEHEVSDAADGRRFRLVKRRRA
jgi:serine/threonine-protein kinase RsbW